MPTGQRVDQIADIAALLLSEYRQGTPLHDIPQRDAESDEDTTFVVEVDAEGTSLAGLVATLDAVQLAVDAAAVAFYYDLEIPGHPDDLDQGLLWKLASEGYVSLQILELADGTWRATLKAVFRNKVARVGVISVATLTVTAVGLFFAPVAAIGGGAIGGIASVAAIVDAVQENKENEAIRRQVEAAKQEAEAAKQEAIGSKQEAEAARREAEAAKQMAEAAKQEAEAARREAEETKASVRRLEEKFAAREAPPVMDPDAAQEAQVRRIDVTVVPPRAA